MIVMVRLFLNFTFTIGDFFPRTAEASGMSKRQDAKKRAWNELYGQLAESEATLECEECGTMLIGDGPTYQIKCLDCFLKQDPLEELIEIAEEQDGQRKDS